jgi:hypothetical protein
MSEADKRVSELLDRWVASLDLHARYLKLSDAEYAKVQQWPKHQRPNRWIIDLARQRVGELRHHLAERREIGDDEFADALELMAFLTSLLASEHLERFVPLALPQQDSTVRQTALKPETGAASPPRSRGSTAPRPAPPKSATARSVSSRPATPAARRANTATVVQRSAPARGAPGVRQTAPAPRPAARPPKLSEQVTKLIVSDAVRLLEWGQEWPQLAGLIARMADRPSEREIWGVLSEHRAAIEARAKPSRA